VIQSSEKANAKIWFARSIAMMASIFVISGWFLMIQFGLPEDLWMVLIVTIGIILYILLALLIIRRHAHHTVGWLLLLTGLIGSLMIFNSGGLFSWGGQWTSVLAKQVITLIDHQLGSLWTAIPVTLVLLYFPDGHLPSSRWKSVLVLVLIGIFSTQVTQAFTSWTVDGINVLYFKVKNPLEFAGSEHIFNGPIGYFLKGLPFLAIFGCLVSIIVRWIHSKGIERLQMKWLVFSATVVISIIFILQILGIPETSPGLMWYFILLSPMLFTLAIGLAILRYRLFDIDIIIRKTIQYTLLTGLLASIYFGVVIILQNIFVSYSNQQSPVIIVVSTLVIAALFNPLRNRIQEFIDHRFYRKKYNAEHALAQFAATARDEVALDQLHAAVIQVVEETMQPEYVSLWMQFGKDG